MTRHDSTRDSTRTRHSIRPRRVRFDFTQSPLQWIPDDPYSSHVINGINLLLPEGELWFCRVYNQALPLVSDPQLREDVQGFVRQEAIHARTHQQAEKFLQAHGLSTDEFRSRAEYLFNDLLGDAPLGIRALKNPLLAKRWLVLRVGIIAAIEHFTGALGQWAMDNKTWDKADPVIADLFRWHLAEEVEHRSVAFDLYQHLCQTQLGFYVSRQVLMAGVYPMFLYCVMEGGRALASQDPDPQARRIGRRSVLQLLWELERTGRRTRNVPTLGYVTAVTLRWISPGFHPVTEGNTEQALAYLARSPAAQAAAS